MKNRTKTRRSRLTNATNIEKTENLDLVLKINKNKNKFFDIIKIKDLKSIDNCVFTKLSIECIKSLTEKNLEILVEANKIEFLPDFFLNEIREMRLNKLSDNFYKKIHENQIRKINDNILKKLIELKKFKIFNDKSLKCFCHKLIFSDLKEDDIFEILQELSEREKKKLENKEKVDYDYIIGENFIYLQNFIKSNKINNYLNYLKKCIYIDNNNNLENFFLKNKKESILKESDIKDEEDEIKIIYDKIPYKIEYYLSNDNFELLKAYCFKCCCNVRNKEKMLSVLDSFLKYSKNNVYDLIDELEIRNILIIISN